MTGLMGAVTDLMHGAAMLESSTKEEGPPLLGRPYSYVL